MADTDLNTSLDDAAAAAADQAAIDAASDQLKAEAVAAQALADKEAADAAAQSAAQAQAAQDALDKAAQAAAEVAAIRAKLDALNIDQPHHAFGLVKLRDILATAEAAKAALDAPDLEPVIEPDLGPLVQPGSPTLPPIADVLKPAGPVPETVTLASPYAYYDDDDVMHAWSADQEVTDPAEVADLVARGAPFKE